jgi:8-oxo-dGTP pyrophosphatase MutT (NUDIX family)
MDPRRIPDRLRDDIRAFAASGSEPVAPRDAASTILLRDGAEPGPGAVEVFLLRRQATMAFAANMAVFPGGGVDPRDRAPGGPTWIGPSEDHWADVLGVDVEQARALLHAAVRETFEESGVLLAGADEHGVVSSTLDEGWEADRRRVEDREISLAQLLDARGLHLRTDLLRAWSCWLTPEFEPRRYRTHFFVARLPAGQETRDVSTEAVSTAWTPSADALRDADGAEPTTPMLPPQYCTCLELYDLPTVDAVLETGGSRRPRTVAPTGVVDGDEVRLDLPADLVALADTVGARQ